MQGVGAVCSMCGDVTALMRNALSSKKQKTPVCRGLDLKRFVVMQGGVQRQQVPPPVHCSLRSLALVPMPVVSDITFQFKAGSGERGSSARLDFPGSPEDPDNISLAGHSPVAAPSCQGAWKGMLFHLCGDNGCFSHKIRKKK